MKTSEQSKLLSHHACCVIGNFSVSDKIISILGSSHHIQAKGNPDFTERKYEMFSIEDARELKAAAGMRPVGDASKKFFVLAMSGITVEAQNALLKLLEEPPSYAQFFIIIPAAHLLLPTIKSRLRFIDLDGVDPGIYLRKEMETLLKSSTAKRLEFVKKLSDDISKEKKTKRDAVEFLDLLERLIYEKDGAKNGKRALEAISLARKYANDRAPSLKMLLEYVILNQQCRTISTNLGNN